MMEFELIQAQPQAIELEAAVLGACLVDRDAFPVMQSILRTPGAMYDSRHESVYSAMSDLYSQNDPIDLLTVMDALKKKNTLKAAGGPAYLAELSNMVASAANLEYHCRIIAQMKIRRDVVEISYKMIQKAHDETEDSIELLDGIQEKIFDITGEFVSSNMKRIGDFLPSILQRTEYLISREAGLTGIPSGFADIDRVTSGWQSSDLVIIAARPGMGKTALALNMAVNASLIFEKPAAIFSIEMSAEQLIGRMISSISNLSSDLIRDPQKMNDNELNAYRKYLNGFSDADIFIDDTPGLSVFELRAKARRLKRSHGIEIIFIDYIQLMTAGANHKGNREQEISAISRNLKGIAKELHIPVIALSQLSRAVEIRGGAKRPQLSDLRESGSLEQDADIVGFLYRPEYYQILEDEEGQSLKGVAEFIIAKHRNGPLATKYMKFRSNLTKFEDIAANDYDETEMESSHFPGNIKGDYGEDLPF